MANTYQVNTAVSLEALRLYINSLKVARCVNRQFDDAFGVSGAKIGNTYNARKPVRYLGNTGQAIAIENFTETTVPIVLTTQFNVAVQFPTADMLLNVDEFGDRVLKPAVAKIANKVDADVVGTTYQAIYNNVGTPGTDPTALSTYLAAGVKLKNQAAPMDGDWHIIIGPQAEASYVGNSASLTLFNPSKEISEQYREGVAADQLGFRWYMDQNMPVFTTGAQGGVPLVDGAGQTGSSLATKGWTALTTVLGYGDTFTLAAVATLNPESLQSMSTLQQFAVQDQTVTSDAGGKATITISPAIVVSGAYATVTGSPADGAAITVAGAASTNSTQGLAMHRDALTLVMANLPVPGGVDIGAVAADSELGISMRVIRDYTVLTDQLPMRVDVLYGASPLRPEWGCRVNCA